MQARRLVCAAGIPGEQHHALLRQRLKWNPKCRLGWQVSQHRAQWMSRIQLIVAIGENHQRTDSVNTTSEELDQIQCRFVGPMDVLKDHNRRSLPLAKAAQEERKQKVPVAIRLERGENC